MNIKDFTEVFKFIEENCPSIKLNDSEIIATYRLYMNWNKKEKDITTKLNDLSDNERLEIFANYCTRCGGKPDCNCMREE